MKYSAIKIKFFEELVIVRKDRINYFLNADILDVKVEDSFGYYFFENGEHCWFDIKSFVDLLGIDVDESYDIWDLLNKLNKIC